MRAIVRFRRNGDDRLRGELGVGFLGVFVCGGGLRAARVERRQILRGLIVDDLGMVEYRGGRGLWFECEESRKGKQECESEKVISAGFEEAAPGKASRNEYVRPEWRRGGMKFEVREPTRVEEVAEISEEDARPGREFYQEPGNGHGFEPARDGCFGHPSMLDGRRRFG